MRLQEIRKGARGHFVNRYDLVYETLEGREKIYEMVSRNPDLKTGEELTGDKPDAVVIIATDGSGEHLLLNREFRPAVNDFVYQFPAGLIEPGERPEEAAVRELREETGLELYEIRDRMGISYSMPGLGNEKNECIVGLARGELTPCLHGDEEIYPGWYTREEVRELMKTKRFASRSQGFCYLWCRMG
ncbi:MAG: NUDIX hydrolase [Lachnospiraceae bacterium]|nr:NUDIX hydrolase [Lachnospiraceae bacterium]